MALASDELERVLDEIAGGTGPTRIDYEPSIAPGNAVGHLDAVFAYAEGHELHLTLAVDTTGGYPTWVHYSFHLQDRRKQLVLRYDDAPYHLSRQHPSPHHRHSHGGEAISALDEPPSLDEITTAIIEAISGEASGGK